MSFTLGASDVYPYVCGIYTCRCGRRAVRHGRGAAELPAGWVEQPGAESDTAHVCKACAEKQRAGKASV